MGGRHSFCAASFPFHLHCFSLQSFFWPSIIFMALFFFLPLQGGNFTIVSISPLPIVPLCLLRCKDNHMLMMDSEWSSDFVFPILGMLRSDENRNLISKRVRAICEQNAEMLECLQKCPGSIENEILQMGLQPWEGICSNLRVLETQIGCWKQNIESITQECAFESQQLRHSTELLTRNVSVALVETICEHLHHLSACFVAEYGKHCGTVSQRLVQSLFESSREVIAKMLQVKWADLPQKCQPNPEFAYPKLAQHSQNYSTANSAFSLNGQIFVKIHLLILIVSIFINFRQFFSFY